MAPTRNGGQGEEQSKKRRRKIRVIKEGKENLGKFRAMTGSSKNPEEGATGGTEF